MVSTPDIVRSINQLGLLKSWMRARGARQLPGLEGLPAQELAGMSADLLFTDVVRREGTTQFRIGSSGERIAEYFGVDCPDRGQGRFLHEVLPLPYRPAALATFREAVAAREPVYTIADMRDRAGRIVHFERLLLPFGRDGTAVDRIIVSIEAVSPEGAFHGHHLMAAPSTPPAFAFCAVIDTREAVVDQFQ
jgi:hypothetical protein